MVDDALAFCDAWPSIAILTMLSNGVLVCIIMEFSRLRHISVRKSETMQMFFSCFMFPGLIPWGIRTFCLYHLCRTSIQTKYISIINEQVFYQMKCVLQNNGIFWLFKGIVENHPNSNIYLTASETLLLCKCMVSAWVDVDHVTIQFFKHTL